MIKKAIVITAVVLFSLVILFFGTGYFANPEWNGSKTKEIDAPLEKVWALLSDTERYSLSRHEVKKVEIVSRDENGYPVWREYTGLAGTILLQITDKKEPETIDVQMLESGFGMTGSWHFALVPNGDKTQVTITEHSVTKGLVMRSILNTIGRDGNLYLQLKAIENGMKFFGVKTDKKMN